MARETDWFHPMAPPTRLRFTVRGVTVSAKAWNRWGAWRGNLGVADSRTPVSAVWCLLHFERTCRRMERERAA